MSLAGGQGDALAPGTMLGRYEIRRPLGRGGMGAVYEALHVDLKKRVAVKVLFGSLAVNEEARQRFLREGEAASRIRHPHVVDVTDVGSDGDRSYLVMELLEGEDLASRLQRGPLSPMEAADILLPVLAGVTAAHDEGVVHRDLKPENIFLSQPRHGGALVPKVLDFGVSKVAGSGRAMALTGTAATFGTPFYMPPEQLRGARQADHKSDQYALGVVLYECVTGRRPFEAENIYAMLRAIGDGDYPPPRSVRPDLPEELEGIITRAMRMDASERFPSLRELGAALLPFASETSHVLWTETFQARARSRAISAGQTQELPPDGLPPLSRAPTPPGAVSGKSVSGTRILPSAPPPPVEPMRLSSPGTTLGTATGQQIASLRPQRSRAGWVVVGFLAAAASAAGITFLVLRPPEAGRAAPKTDRPVAQTYRAEVITDPPSATLELDGEIFGRGSLRRTFRKDGISHHLVARAAGYRDASVRFTDEPPPGMLTLDPLPAEATPDVAAQPAAAVRPVKPPRHRHPTAPSAPRGESRPPRAAPSNDPLPANGAPVID